MPKDLRSFIEQLANATPDQIQMVTAEVEPKFGITAIAGKLAKQGRFPALLFTNVKGSSLPLVINLTASYERLALALGTDVSEVVRVYGQRQANPLPPRLVTEAPVQEVILEGEKAKLSTLPIPTHNELDSGPYVTGGVLICKDPDTGQYNAGIYRHEVQGEQQLGVYFQGSHHGGYIYRRYCEMNRPMEAAIAIGHYPTFILGAVSKLPGSGGEFEEAGALLGEPLELVSKESCRRTRPILKARSENGRGITSVRARNLSCKSKPSPCAATRSTTMSFRPIASTWFSEASLGWAAFTGASRMWFQGWSTLMSQPTREPTVTSRSERPRRLRSRRPRLRPS
ncbi:MAG: UbiD family decarboxylase [Deltaproteobacteria bacterium]|nr:UbiD family decarboxylase [Deltaproteobacteria bacterium]